MSHAAWSARDAAALALVCACCLLVYAPVLGSFYVGDDFSLYSSLLNYDAYTSIFLAKPHFRPLGMAIFFFEGRLLVPQWSGLSHGFNLALHAANATLAYVILSRRLRYGFAASLMLSLLYAVMPTHVEAVSWLAARFDLLATFFAFSAALCFFRHVETGSRLPLAGYAAFFLCSLLSKEMAILLPVSLFCLCLYHRPPAGRRRFAALACASAAVVLAYLALRHALMGGLGGYAMSSLPGVAAVPVARKVVMSFVKPLTGVVGAGGEHLFWWAAFALLPAFLLACFWRMRRLCWLMAAFVAAALLAYLLPARMHSIEGGRYYYYPGFFLAILLWESLGRFATARNVILGLLIVHCAASAWADARTWTNVSLVSRHIVEGFSGNPASDVDLLNCPDAVEGVVVCRSGFIAAGDFLPGRPMPRINVLATQNWDGRAGRPQALPASPGKVLVDFDSDYRELKPGSRLPGVEGTSYQKADGRAYVVEFEGQRRFPRYVIEPDGTPRCVDACP